VTDVLAPRFEPLDEALLVDPYPTYAFYRDREPVHWGMPAIEGLPGSWYVFSYQENAAVLSDAATYASNPASAGIEGHIPEAFRPMAAIFQRFLGGIDAPNHRRLRSIMAKAFTPRRIEAMRPRIESITAACLDRAMDRGDGTFDVVTDLAFPIPMSVVGDALGVVPDDWPLFQGWASDITHAFDHAADPEAAGRGGQAVQAMFDYLAARLAERRSRPGDDLLSAMVAAADDDGQPMEEFDAIAIACELGFAGHETTTNSVAKSVLGLMDQRDQWEALCSASEATWDVAVEELLRWTTPVQRQRWRWTTVDTELAGRTIAAATSVVCVLGAANRDPRLFADPDRIDFTRAKPRHLTFGVGEHFCLGSTLARLELRTALSQLTRRCPELRLAQPPEEIEWHPNFSLPGPRSVRVRVAP